MLAMSPLPLCALMLVDHSNPQPDGTVTLSMPDGTVVSCQPGGTLQYRPAGTAGAYEKCTLGGSFVTFRPDETAVYQFAFAAAVPN